MAPDRNRLRHRDAAGARPGHGHEIDADPAARALSERGTGRRGRLRAASSRSGFLRAWPSSFRTGSWWRRGVSLVSSRSPGRACARVLGLGVSRMSMPVVGRDAEFASIRNFVAGVSDGASAFVLEGEAGAGKTTLWTASTELAEEQGVRVLRAQPAEPETNLSFSGIGDLLEPVLEPALEHLPAPQRRALARALLLEADEGPAPDPHVIGVAVLGSMRALAEELPLLVAIDDVQWLDTASSSAVTYAARRLRAEPIGLLLARRVPLTSSLSSVFERPAGRVRATTLEVGPMDLRGLHQVVQQHLGVVLPRPLLAEIHEASGGNPFFALEIARALRRTGISVEDRK